MVHIPDSLCSLFSATVEERDGRYVIEVPAGEVEQDAIDPSETYRVAILGSSGSPESAPGQESQSTHSRATVSEGPPEPPVDAGDTRVVEIESLGDQGDGIARVDRGFVVIVPDTEPTERVEVEITDVRESVAFAAVTERLEYYE